MTAQSTDEGEIRTIYHQLLNAWNMRDAHAYAALFADDSNVVGFDGSLMNGRTEIESELSRIFAHHQTAPYVGKVRDVRFLAPDVALLHAVSGMPISGKAEINPAVNSIQTVVAQRLDNHWRIVLFQNTPAQFHGRPDLSEALTKELQQLL